MSNIENTNISPSNHSIKIGQLAPNFKADAYVSGQDFKTLSLRDFQNQWICLFFYPLDFTFVCPTEIRAFAEKENEFKNLNCQILACSIDSKFSHKAWYERDLKDVKFPILSDITHKISRDYGVLLEDQGIALRGTFLIDPKGSLQWMTLNALNIGRCVEEILRTLNALKTGELCPANWKPGQHTLK